MMEKAYVGKIKQGGAQVVKAPKAVAANKGKGSVKTGTTDLRCGK